MLQDKVDAVNKAHKLVLEIFPTLVETFKPFVEKKIIKEDTLLISKIVLPPAPEGCQFWHDRDALYTLRFGLRCNVGKASHETSINVGGVYEKVLKEIYQKPLLRTNYTVEEVQRKRSEFDAALRALSNARDALYPFSEY